MGIFYSTGARWHNLYSRSILIDRATVPKHGGDRKSEHIKIDNINLDISENDKPEVPDGTGETTDFSSFKEFVEMPPLLGLGATLPLIKRICGNDTETLDLIDRATANPNGTNQYSIQNVGVDNVNTHIEERPDGNDREYALRKLRKDRPDLHQEVIAGEIIILL